MPDVEVRAKDFGQTSGVERLGGIPYYAKFVDYFVARGYERGRSIRAAPYDWRLDACTSTAHCAGRNYSELEPNG